MRSLSSLPTLIIICSLLAPRLVACTCTLTPGLYENRRDIERRYAREVGNNSTVNKAAAESLLQAKMVIDKEYYDFVSAIFQKLERMKGSTSQSCCTGNTTDPIVLQACALASYLMSDGKDVAAFVGAVPDTKESADALWSLDEIAHVRDKQGNPQPLLLAPSGPVSTYLERLFSIVVRGNSEALNKYLDLYIYADGEWAEFMENQLETLLSEHPSVVVENWGLIRGHKNALSNLREAMPLEKRQDVLLDIEKQCALTHQDCGEILGVLK